jgi:hypothetical protein
LFGWPFRKIYLIDTEFYAPAGCRPLPLCIVIQDILSGQIIRQWLADSPTAGCPFEPGPDVLHVNYLNSAEQGVYLAMGWELPQRQIDLHAEFRLLTSGVQLSKGPDGKYHSLLCALHHFGLTGSDALHKDAMRELAMRGGPYTEQEIQDLLVYCESDVVGLGPLLEAMAPGINLAEALLRGRYMAAVARIEWNGCPVDVEMLDKLLRHWTTLRNRLVRAVNKDIDVFVPAGQRKIDPDTQFGMAVAEWARDYGIDGERLGRVAWMVWEEERDATEELREARRVARRETGLTPLAMAAWENAGRDYSEWSGLDGKARELARLYPVLGIGPGYSTDFGEDKHDYAGALWELLRRRDESVKPKYHPDILRKAAEMVAAAPDDDGYLGPLKFSTEKFARLLIAHDIAWPQSEDGVLATDEDTLAEMAKIHPVVIGPVKDMLNIHRGELKKIGLTVGDDGRNRCLLSPFASSTGRNQPSNAKYIFGLSSWLRSLIKPGPGMALCYLDWSAQEYAIAAYLSGDKAMQEAYASGDPYLWLAKKVGAVPLDATKKSHPGERERFKTVSLGVLYGLSPHGLARKLDMSLPWARELLQYHKRVFWQYWEWSDNVEAAAMLELRQATCYGWQTNVPDEFDPKTGKSLANPRRIRNFPMQAHGAEMMRLACCEVTEAGIRLCAVVHDALLIEAPIDEIEEVAERTKKLMDKAADPVLPGFEVRVDKNFVQYPDRYIDPRGEATFAAIEKLLAELEAEGGQILGDGWEA